MTISQESNKSLQWGLWCAILFAIIVCLSKFGIDGLNPFNDLWLMTAGSDWTPDYMAWMYYRNADFSFPLGVFQGYSYPETVSIGLTGAIPLLAVPLKLFRGILPTTFQYFGFWLYLCYILQAFFAYRLFRILGVKDEVIRMLGACFMVLSYSLLDRLAHTNLCAHWQLLAGLCVYFGVENPRKAMWQHALIIFASVWTHPYLVVFTLTISWANYLKFYFQKTLNKWKFVMYGLSSLLWVIISWVLIGNHVLKSKSAAGEGFGVFSANLNTFWTPKIDGLIMPALARYYETQYEGVAYLGIAAIIAALLLPFFIYKSTWKPRFPKSYYPILGLGIVLFFLALSNQITFNEIMILHVKLPPFIMGKLGILRASGRYVWLIQYLLMIGFIVAYYKIDLNKWLKYLILFLVVVINFIDFWPQIKKNAFFATHFPIIENVHREEWTKIIRDAEDFIMFPTHRRSYNKYNDDMLFAEIAGKNKQKFNSGHLARFNGELRNEYREAVKDTLENMPQLFSNKTIITGEKHLGSFQNLMKESSHELFMIDGYFAFIPKLKDAQENAVINDLLPLAQKDSISADIETFGAFAQRNEDNYMLIAVMDDAASYMANCRDIKKHMKAVGSVIPSLHFRESYVGIMRGNELIEEKRGIENDIRNSVTLEKVLELEDNGEKIKKNVELFSADKDNGNEARIFVGDTDFAVNDRGLNIVVLSPSGKVLETTRFDTFMMCHHFSEKSKLFYKVWSIK